jgi:type IV pilus assembly protein PilA
MPERSPEQHHRPNAVSEIFITIVVVAGLVLLGGLLAAGASINFFKPNRVYKETEAKSTLGLAYVAERSFRVETGRYSDKLTELGFLPERGNRYVYVF